MRITTSRLKKTLSYEVFLIPAVVLYTVFFIIPLFSSIFYSFTNLSLLHKTINFVGIRNYIKVFKDGQIISSIKNTLIFAFSSTLIANVLAIFFAICLDNKFKSSNIIRMLIFAPAVMSSLVIGYIWSYILSSDQYGMINSILSRMGVNSINWLGDAKYAMLCIILVYTWQWTGWCMVIYHANLQTIPEEYYEAAKIDGANSIQRVFRITLPLMVTSVTINSVLFIIGGLKVYDIIISTTNGGPGFATESFTTVLVKRVFGMSQYGYGSAIAIVLFLIIFLIELIQLKYLRKWEKKVL